MLDARSDGVTVIIKKRPYKAMISFITLVAFFCNIIAYDVVLLRPMGFVGEAWADRTPSELTSVGSDRAVSPGVFKELNVKTFALPPSLGAIKDAWQPAFAGSRLGQNYTSSVVEKDNFGLARTVSGPTNQFTIIHIQDAHCNYYAQHAIVKILEYLAKEYGISTINLEGGARDYDLSIFTGIKDETARERVADYFVKEGIVNGAEYFAALNPDKVTLWGIEDTKLYIDNLKVYRDSLQFKPDADRLLTNLSSVLANLKMKIYSKELLALDLKYNRYKADNIEFKDYLNYLIANSKDKLIDIKSFPDIFLLNQVIKGESGIDFRKANNQRDDLIDKLEKRLSKNAIEKLITRTVEFKSGTISQEEFYRYLMKSAATVSMSIENFPELEKYIVYISSYAAIDKSKVMDEVTVLENKIRDTLCRNDRERQLDRLSRNLAILKNIFNISLTRTDYGYYKANESAFDMSNYISFINRESPLDNRDCLPGRGITKVGTVPIQIQDLDGYRASMSKFYEYSFKRDGAFMKNLVIAGAGSRLGQNYSSSEAEGRVEKPNFGLARTVNRLPNPQVTIVITGGFHTENLCEQFKKNNIAYISIMPNFKNSEGYRCPYFSLLAGNRDNPVEHKIITLLNSVMAVASPFTALNDAVRKMAGESYSANVLRLELEWVAAQADGKQGIVVKHGGKVLGAIGEKDKPLITVDGWNEMSEDKQGSFKIAYITNFVPSLQLPVSEKPIKTATIASFRATSVRKPKHIYMNLPKRYFTIVTTLPNAFTTIRWDYSEDAKNTTENDLILTFENNGTVKWTDLGPEYDFDKKPGLVQIQYRGITYTIDEFREEANTIFKDDLEMLSEVSVRGQYLYRAVDRLQWRGILETGYFCIIGGDNFEDNLGPQVRHYATDKDYAGMIVRIAIAGPYFRHAGFQVPRVTCMMPHFVKPEILISKVNEPEQWVSVEEYLRIQKSKESVVATPISSAAPKPDRAGKTLAFAESLVPIGITGGVAAILLGSTAIGWFAVGLSAAVLIGIIAREIGKMRGKQVGLSTNDASPSPPTLRKPAIQLSHVTRLQNIETILYHGFYNAVNYGTFLPYGSDYPTYGDNSKIEIVFNAPVDLVEEKPTGKVYALSTKSLVKADEAEKAKEILGENLKSIGLYVENGIGWLPASSIDLAETIRKNNGRYKSGVLSVDAFRDLCNRVRKYIESGNVSQKTREIVLTEIASADPNRRGITLFASMDQPPNSGAPSRVRHAVDNLPVLAPPTEQGAGQASRVTEGGGAKQYQTQPPSPSATAASKPAQGLHKDERGYGGALAAVGLGLLSAAGLLAMYGASPVLAAVFGSIGLIIAAVGVVKAIAPPADKAPSVIVASTVPEEPAAAQAQELFEQTAAVLARAVINVVRRIHDGRYDAVFMSGESDEIVYDLFVEAWGAIYPAGENMPVLCRLGGAGNRIIYKDDGSGRARHTLPEKEAVINKALGDESGQRLAGLRTGRVLYLDDHVVNGDKYAGIISFFKSEASFTDVDYACYAMNPDNPFKGKERVIVGTTDLDSAVSMENLAQKLGFLRESEAGAGDVRLPEDEQKAAEAAAREFVTRGMASLRNAIRAAMPSAGANAAATPASGIPSGNELPQAARGAPEPAAAVVEPVRMSTAPGRLDASNEAIAIMARDIGKGKVVIYDVATGWTRNLGPITTIELAGKLKEKNVQAEVIGIDLQMPAIALCRIAPSGDCFSAALFGPLSVDRNAGLAEIEKDLDKALIQAEQENHTYPRSKVPANSKKYYIEWAAKLIKEGLGKDHDGYDDNGGRLTLIYNPAKNFTTDNLKLIKGDAMRLDETVRKNGLPKAYIARIADLFMPHLGVEAIEPSLKSQLSAVEDGGYVLIGVSHPRGLRSGWPEEQYFVYKKTEDRFVLYGFMFSIAAGPRPLFGAQSNYDFPFSRDFLTDRLMKNYKRWDVYQREIERLRDLPGAHEEERQYAREMALVLAEDLNDNYGIASSALGAMVMVKIPEEPAVNPNEQQKAFAEFIQRSGAPIEAAVGLPPSGASLLAPQPVPAPIVAPFAVAPAGPTAAEPAAAPNKVKKQRRPIDLSKLPSLSSEERLRNREESHSVRILAAITSFSHGTNYATALMAQLKKVDDSGINALKILEETDLYGKCDDIVTEFVRIDGALKHIYGLARSIIENDKEQGESLDSKIKKNVRNIEEWFGVMKKLYGALKINNKKLELLIDGLRNTGNENGRSELERLLKDTRELEGILLDRINMVTGKISNELVDMNDIVKTAAQLIPAEYGLPYIKDNLKISASDGPIWVKGNRRSLISVVTNLVANAFKYAGDEEGSLKYAGRDVVITLRIKKEGDRIIITVIDNGKGINVEFHGMGNPFYTTNGTGIGLTECTAIVENHGGWLGIESEAGIGTMFEINLPAAPHQIARVIARAVIDVVRHIHDQRYDAVFMSGESAGSVRDLFIEAWQALYPPQKKMPTEKMPIICMLREKDNRILYKDEVSHMATHTLLEKEAVINRALGDESGTLLANLKEGRVVYLDDHVAYGSKYEGMMRFLKNQSKFKNVEFACYAINPRNDFKDKENVASGTSDLEAAKYMETLARKFGFLRESEKGGGDIRFADNQQVLAEAAARSYVDRGMAAIKNEIKTAQPLAFAAAPIDAAPAPTSGLPNTVVVALTGVVDALPTKVVPMTEEERLKKEFAGIREKMRKLPNDANRLKKVVELVSKMNGIHNQLTAAGASQAIEPGNAASVRSPATGLLTDKAGKTAERREDAAANVAFFSAQIKMLNPALDDNNSEYGVNMEALREQAKASDRQGAMAHMLLNAITELEAADREYEKAKTELHRAQNETMGNKEKVKEAEYKDATDEALAVMTELISAGISASDLAKLTTPGKIENFTRERNLADKIKDHLNQWLASNHEYATTVAVLDEGDRKPHSVYVITIDGNTYILEVGDEGTFTTRISALGPAAPVTAEIVRHNAESLTGSKTTQYIKTVFEAVKELLPNSNISEGEKYIFVPISEKLCKSSTLRNQAQKLWHNFRLKLGEYRINSVIVVFYDGSVKDLDSKLTGKMNKNNTFIFIDGNQNKDAEMYKKIIAEYNVAKDVSLDEGEGYISIGGHVALGLGLLELRNNPNKEYYSYVLRLIRAMQYKEKTSDAMPVDKFMVMLDQGNLSIILPPLKREAIDEDMQSAVIAEDVAMSSV